jgi:Cu+-exporting ATPase
VVFAGEPDIGAVVFAVDRAGYRATVETARFDIEKMTCASCLSRVEKALTNMPGVLDANVNLAARTGTVRSKSPLRTPLWETSSLSGQAKRCRLTGGWSKAPLSSTNRC